MFSTAQSTYHHTTQSFRLCDFRQLPSKHTRDMFCGNTVPTTIEQIAHNTKSGGAQPYHVPKEKVDTEYVRFNLKWTKSNLQQRELSEPFNRKIA